MVDAPTVGRPADPAPGLVIAAGPAAAAAPVGNPVVSTNSAGDRALGTPVPIATAAPIVQTGSTNEPTFSDVSRRTPTEGVAYLRGQLPEYPGTAPDRVTRFSASDILETMDTAVLDDVQRQTGAPAVQQLYDLIARSILDTIKEVYGDARVVVPLDAGHGGYRPTFWDSGSNGTEATHTRAVVAAMQKLARAASYSRVILRPIFNDAVSEDFGLPSAMNEPSVNASLIRLIRASMLAAEAAAWNQTHGLLSPMVVHEISIHFNAGSGGALVLCQGNTAPPAFEAQSISFGRAYLHRAVPALNASGLLPSPLKLFGADGLHDDLMMYNPDRGSPHALDDQGLTLRYGMLQTNDYTPYYIAKVLKSGLGSNPHA